MTLRDTMHRKDQPMIGALVTVTVGMIRKREIEGRIVHVTATRVTVEYVPSAGYRTRTVFRKDDGWRVGDRSSNFFDGPKVSLKGDE
jgi:hypothetical protein